jgi:hypothetical protein
VLKWQRQQARRPKLWALQSADAALLDGNLNGRPVDDIAAALTRRNVPFAFVTGYGRESVPPAFGAVTLLAKPFGQSQPLEVATQSSNGSASFGSRANKTPKRRRVHVCF